MISSALIASILAVSGCATGSKFLGTSPAPGVWDFGHFPLPMSRSSEAKAVQTFVYERSKVPTQTALKLIRYSYDFPLFAKTVYYKIIESNATGIKCSSGAPHLRYFLKQGENKSSLGEVTALAFSVPNHTHASLVIEVDSIAGCEKIDFRLAVESQ
jgi:hypothetical protein